MKNAESVTFGGSGLNRAAECRGDISPLLKDPKSVGIAIWRGKPLISGMSRDQLVRLPLSAGLFSYARTPPLFLGIEGDVAVFAYDVSSYEPDDTLEAVNTFLDASEQSVPELPEDHRFSELRIVMTHLSPRDAELAATARGMFEWHRTHGFCAFCGAQSTPAQAGWQRDCPSCERHHFPRTDPVVIMLITDGNACLLGRSPAWPVGMYSCLAGFVEPGETLEAAVRREVFEEAGVRVGQVKYLSSQPWPFPASLMMGCHGIATSSEISIDPSEIEDAIWVSKEELMQSFAGAHPKIQPARNGAIAHFLLKNWLSDTLD